MVFVKLWLRKKLDKRMSLWLGHAMYRKPPFYQRVMFAWLTKTYFIDQNHESKTKGL